MEPSLLPAITDPLVKDRHRRRRRQAYVAGLVLVALWTIGQVSSYFSGRTEFSSSFYILNCLTIAGTVWLWCWHDSFSRGKRLPLLLEIGIGLLGPICVPIYFLKTRGLAQGAKSLFGLLLYVPFYIVFFAAGYATVIALRWLGIPTN